MNLNTTMTLIMMRNTKNNKADPDPAGQTGKKNDLFFLFPLIAHEPIF
jgi:hypothetical protein